MRLDGYKECNNFDNLMKLTNNKGSVFWCEDVEEYTEMKKIINKMECKNIIPVQTTYDRYDFGQFSETLIIFIFDALPTSGKTVDMYKTVPATITIIVAMMVHIMLAIFPKM